MYQAKTFKNNQFYFQKSWSNRQASSGFWQAPEVLLTFFFSKKDENTVSVHSWSELGVRFFCYEQGTSSKHTHAVNKKHQ